jgi:hypothetical protein
MDALRELWWAALAVAVVAAAATALGGYLISGRYGPARKRLQTLVVEVLRDTGQGAFLFVLSRNARKVEVRIPADPSGLQTFEQALTTRLDRELPGTQVVVVPLREPLDHLHGAVAVWSHLYGDTYVARGGVDNAA